MQTRHTLPLLGLALLAGAAASGCEPAGLLGGPEDAGAVFIVATERLAPPAVAEPNLYRPDFIFAIDPANPSAGQAAGFFLEIATASPGRLKMCVLTGAGNPPAALVRISPPDSESLQSPDGWLMPIEARDLLLAGQGLFWLDGAPGGNGVFRQRVGVALPDTWTQPSITLKAYTVDSASGEALQPAAIELAHDFFYMAAIGDSVIWGNGLREHQKFSHLVAAEIQRRTGQRVILQVHAISGVPIVPRSDEVICRVRCNGEVQTATTSVTSQVDLLEAPQSLHLVLMDGCINDVGVDQILNTDTRQEALVELTRSVCHDEMLKLLRKVRSAAPQARIVVTGYFDIISAESKLPELAQYIFVHGTGQDPTGLGVAREIADQSRLFQETSAASLAAAVQEANAEAGEPAMIAFTDPGFGPQNALFASESLLWGLTADRIQQRAADEGLTLFPEDPLADLRATGCLNNKLVDPIPCLYASVGHPNPAGALRYAEVIISALEQLGVIPIAAPSQ